MVCGKNAEEYERGEGGKEMDRKTGMMWRLKGKEGKNEWGKETGGKKRSRDAEKKE